jgi:MEMO1 family protein
MMPTLSDLRPSPIAGTWYPGSKERLAQTVDDFLAAAVLPELDGEVVGVIAPHAGHRYSGRTAGYAFRALQGLSFDLAAVVSPMHGYHPEPLITSAHRAYSTPLGAIPIDPKALDALDAALQDAGLKLTRLAEDPEHSLEIELPFLQRALAGDFHLLPVMLRTHAPEVLETLGNALAAVMKDRKAVLVASTDLSHFFPETVANTLDQFMLDAVATGDPHQVLDAESGGKGQACGAAAVAAVLWAARALGTTSVKVLHHSTSADETGDRSQVVGYGAAVILKKS